MKKTLFILIIVFAGLQSFSQEDYDSLKITQFNIKTSPLTPFDPLISSAQIALEYRHKHKYAIQGSYYIKTPQILAYLRDKENEKLNEFKFEVKRFFQDELYIALEYGFIDHRYTYRDEYFINESFSDENLRDISMYRYDEASFQKNIQMINAKFGVQYNSRKYPRLLFDFFIGVGVRNINYSIDPINIKPVQAFPQVGSGEKSKHTYGIKQADGTYIIDGIDQQNPPSNAEDLGSNTQGVKNDNGTYTVADIQTPDWDLTPTDGSEWKGNFTFGIKIGYTLWSKYKY